MKILKSVIILIIGVCFCSKAIAQEEHEKEFLKHKVMLVIGHAAIPAGIDRNGDKVWTILPSWGFDYDYRFNEKWSIGLHTDIVVESFEYEHNEIVFERTRPFTAVFVGSRKFGDHLTFVLGGGVELAQEENLNIIRLGFDYGWELPNEWELGASVMSDFKLDAYNSWVLGLGVAKLF